MTSRLVLKRLTPAGLAAINEEFLTSADAALDLNPAFEEQIPVTVYLDEFLSLAETAVRSTAPGDSDLDAELAVQLHKALPLSHRVAMDRTIWYYLSCCVAPTYVRHRWREKGRVKRERFLSPLRRNCFWRLWWSAELLRKGGDYSAVASCFKYQDLYEALLGRAFSRFPPAARIFANVLSKEQRSTVRKTTININYVLSTVVLEMLDDAMLTQLCQELAAANRPVILQA